METELTKEENEKLNLFKNAMMISMLQTIQTVDEVPPLDFLAAVCCLPDLEYFQVLNEEKRINLSNFMQQFGIGDILTRQQSKKPAMSLMYNSSAVLDGMSAEERTEIEECKNVLTLTMLMISIKVQEAPSTEIVKAIARLPDLQPLYELEDTQLRDNLIEILRKKGFSRLLDFTD